MDPVDVQAKTMEQTLYGFAVLTVSAVVFYFLSVVVEKHLTPKSVITHNKKDTVIACWKWKNILVSFVHSLLTGIWAVACFINHPEMAEDLISTCSTFSHTLVAVSLGYFVHDIIDMLVYRRSRQSLELIIHHCVILVCFGLALVTQFYVGYAVVALLVELNSVFLHTRSLLTLAGYTKDNSVYRTNSLLNLGTYVVFRITTLAWMTRWIVVNRDLVPFVTYTIGSVSLAIITLMNIVLFYRLLHSDFLRQRRPDNNTRCNKAD